jgi:hypothetical protein
VREFIENQADPPISGGAIFSTPRGSWYHSLRDVFAANRAMAS